jgi:DNA-binding MarR family transcriptional regulator
MNGPTDLCNNAALRQATRRMGQLYDDAIAPTGLRATQHGMLTQIDFMQQPTMRELAEALVMDLSALGHTLKPLMRDGLVELTPDENDRRAKRVRLTTMGKAKFQQALQLWRVVQGRFEAAFGRERAAELRSTLNFIASDEFVAAFRQKRDT